MELLSIRGISLRELLNKTLKPIHYLSTRKLPKITSLLSRPPLVENITQMALYTIQMLTIYQFLLSLC